MKYIMIVDSTGHENLWQIIEEVNNGYKVQRCETVDFIYKALCWEVEGSNVLHTNIMIDFKPTKIKYKNINSICENCGFRDSLLCNCKDADVFEDNSECWFYKNWLTMRCQKRYRTDMGYMEEEA